MLYGMVLCSGFYSCEKVKETDLSKNIRCKLVFTVFVSYITRRNTNKRLQKQNRCVIVFIMERNILGKGWGFPVTTDVHGNIALSRYEKSIEESIRIILGTTPGERVMNPDFGCKINDILFSPRSPKTISLAIHYIEEALVRCEPRII